MIVKAKAEVEVKEEITSLSTSKSVEKLTVQLYHWGVMIYWGNFHHNLHILGPRVTRLGKVLIERYNGF